MATPDNETFDPHTLAPRSAKVMSLPDVTDLVKELQAKRENSRQRYDEMRFARGF